MASGRKFVKMQGLRNHFVVVDARRDPFVPGKDEIVRICDVQVGVGADQLVVIDKPGSSGMDRGATASVRFYNVDGTEAEACGNATRCVARLLLEESASDAVGLETSNGVLHCRTAGQGRITCSMGPVTMDWRRIPLARASDTLHLGLSSGPLVDPVGVAVGNPHAVFFVSDLDAIDVGLHAPPIQRHELFPRQANVGVAQIVSADRLRLAVFERGAGLTTACGSGACAAVYAARARGLSDSGRMSVLMAGGEVEIHIGDDDVATMTGPAEYSFRGELP